MNKKNILAITILAILILVFFLSKGKENVEKRSGIFNFKTTDITKIEIIQPPYDTLTVAMEDKIWTIIHPRRLPAKESQIQRFFDEFLTITTSQNSISDSPERQEFYQVSDSTGVKITVFGKKGKKLRTVFFGRNFQNQQYAYIRAEKDNNIYQIDNVFHIINPSLQNWREDRIVTFTADQIVKIQTDRYELSQETGMWMVSNPQIGTMDIVSPTSSEFTRIMNGITGLRTSTFFDDVYDTYAEKLTTPTMQMMITLNNGENVYLKLAQNDANSYILQLNEQHETLYRLTNAQFGNLNIDPSQLVDTGI